MHYCAPAVFSLLYVHNTKVILMKTDVGYQYEHSTIVNSSELQAPSPLVVPLNRDFLVGKRTTGKLKVLFSCIIWDPFEEYL